MEVLFEFTRIGAQVKVVAVDPVTGIEAVIVGPSNLGERTLKNNAVRKLNYLLEKEKKNK